jgi:hypothetical protein
MSENQDRQAIRDMLTKRYNGVIPVTDEMIDAVLTGLADQPSDLYQVTANSAVVAAFPNGHLAQQFAAKFFTTRAARGKVIAIRRSDGKTPYTS